jgi:hypothetical protein
VSILSGVDDPFLATEASVDEKPAIDGTLKPIVSCGVFVTFRGYRSPF